MPRKCNPGMLFGKRSGMFTFSFLNLKRIRRLLGPHKCFASDAIKIKALRRP